MEALQRRDGEPGKGGRRVIVLCMLCKQEEKAADFDGQRANGGVGDVRDARQRLVQAGRGGGDVPPVERAGGGQAEQG